MKRIVHASLFSGFGGPDLAAEWMGWDNAFHCEINEFCNTILEYHFPKSKTYRDVTTTDFTGWRGRVDVLTGGFPCQPFSLAGQRKGADDNRYLWPHLIRAVREIKPTWVIGENVGGILTMVQSGTEIEVGCQTSLFDADNKETILEEEFVVETICKDLEREGYSVQPVVIPACAIGAPHRRDRVFFIAHRSDAGIESLQRGRENGIHESGSAPDTYRNDARRPRHGEVGCTKSEGKEKQRERKWARCYIERTSSEATTSNTESKQGERMRFKQREVSIEKQRELGRGHSKDGCKWNVANSNSKFSAKWVLKRANRWCNKEVRVNPSHRTGSWSNFPTQSPVCSRNDGFSASLDGITFSKWRQESVKGFGNAIVPQVMYELFKAIEEIETKIF